MDGLASRFETGAATHVGMVRDHNEDRFLVLPEAGVWAVADGMGGHADGALASATVAEALASIGAPASAPDLLARLEDRVLRANARLQEIARRSGAIMGSTVAVLLVYEDCFACVWSGDSRIYLVRAGRMAQLSRDHTEAQELVEQGMLTQDEALAWPRRNVLTRAIGAQVEPEMEIEHGLLQAGDAFVICSDGLTNHVADHEIMELVATLPAQAACDALVARTLARGAQDNVTVVIVRYDSGGSRGEALDAASGSG